MALILLNQTFTPTESGILYSLRAMAPTQDEMSDSGNNIVPTRLQSLILSLS